MRSESLLHHDEAPAGDHIVILRQSTWADYQRVLEMRGERSTPRLAYLEGALELMSPSREHEALKSNIGRLVEVWCQQNGIEFSPYGSWTLESKESQRGVEPDECYVFGDPAGSVRPELAIEVIWTSGGLDKREIYRALGVREVWFWRRGRIGVHVLHEGAYHESPKSAVLPGIDLDLLASFLDRPTASQAIREYQSALSSRP